MNEINKALQERLARFKEQSGLNQSQIARAVTVAPAAISMYLNGTYADKGGKYATIEPKIEAFLDREAAKAQRDDLEIGFVSTRTARRIAEMMRDAHEAGDFAVIYGQAGLGKTEAVKAYCRNNPGAVLIETNPSYTAQVLMRKLAEACKVGSTGTLNDMFDAVCDRLDGSGRLIVVDEAENLPLRALEILRRLHDMTGCGLVFSGMPKLIANMRGRYGEQAQLYSRTCGSVNLGDTVPEEELAEIAKNALPNADEDTIAALVKESGGNVRRLTKLMRGAVRVAKKNGLPLSAGIVKKYSGIIIK